LVDQLAGRGNTRVAVESEFDARLCPHKG
jgi:hypothetical protein